MNIFHGAICLKKKKLNFLSQIHLKLRTMSRAEKFIEDCTRNCSNEIIGEGWDNGEFVQIFKPWLTPDEARRAVDIAREEIYEWLRVNLCDYFDASREDYDMCINDLKQAMKDE